MTDPKLVTENQEVTVHETPEPTPSSDQEDTVVSELDAEESAAMPSSELTSLLEAIQLLSSKFDVLQRGFDSKIKYDASKERVIDTLHKELDAYRQDMHFNILRPLFVDLIAMHDDISHLMRDADEVTSEARAWRNLFSFQETIEEILYRHGVDVYSVEGEAFVAHRQRSIKTIKTEQAEKNRVVAQRIRKGFEYEGRILRPELVATFRFTKKG